MKFKKKPVEVDAIQWTGDNLAAVIAFGDKKIIGVDDMGWYHFAEDFNPKKLKLLVIGTLEGQMNASVGDWIVRGSKGEVYPVKPDIFEETYEPV